MARYDEQIAGRLMHDLMADFGLNRQQAAGIVGNLAHESGGFSNLQEDEPIIPGSRGGFGYAQWTASRRRNFENFVGEKDWDIRSYQANYGNLKRELKGEYAYVIDRIKGVTTSKEAAKLFQDQFERPHKDHQHTARRAKLAADILVNPNAGFVAPFPTERGVTQQTDLVRRQTLDPHSVNMGLLERQEPAWSDQFAPGPTASPLSAIQNQPVRSDYPTSPHNPEPWQDLYAPAPQYALRTASPARFSETFAPSDPQAPPLTPGTSNTGKAAAYRGLADTMQQAGIGGLDGRAATRSKQGGLSAPSINPAQGFVPDIDSVPYPIARPPMAPTPEFAPPIPSGRPPASVPLVLPIPRSRPQSGAPKPALRPTRPSYTDVPVPTPRPATSSGLPMMSSHHKPNHQHPSPYTGPKNTGPKKQIFNFVLRQLIRPDNGPK